MGINIVLALPSISMLSVDTVNPVASMNALARSLKLVIPHSAHLLTTIQKFPGIVETARRNGIRVIDHHQTSTTKTYPGIPRKFFVDYETSVLSEPANLFESLPASVTHILFMEWDAGILNPLAWVKKWLSYDFIGAPWAPHHDPGWPRCDGIKNAVGNTGFSLMSRKFGQESRALFHNSDDPYRFCSDSWICRTMRDELENLGIKFSPVKVASKFSCENRIYSGQFGFHGKGTIEMNGWKLN